MNTKALIASGIIFAGALLTITIADTHFPDSSSSIATFVELIRDEGVVRALFFLALMPLLLIAGLFHPPMFLYGVAGIALYAGMIVGIAGLTLDKSRRT